MKKFMVGLLALFFIAQGALAGASISLSLCNANLNQVAIAFSSSPCLIEWACLIQEILPEECIQIQIDKDLERGFDYRSITVA